MKTRRQLIQMMPALPLAGVATAGLLAACGDKQAAAPAAPPAPAPVAAAPVAPPAVATPEPAPAASPAPAAANLPLVDEKDPQAMALGYVNDASRTDKAKYPKYVEGQACANCALFQGAAGATQGPCPLYPGKNVSAKAWCSAYNKKAA